MGKILLYRAGTLYRLEYVVPCTTRKIRTEEVNGKDYYFLSKQEFQLRVRDGRMTEWDYSLDNYYGYDFQFPGNNKKITHGLSRMALRIKKQHSSDITTVFLMHVI